MSKPEKGTIWIGCGQSKTGAAGSRIWDLFVKAPPCWDAEERCFHGGGWFSMIALSSEDNLPEPLRDLEIGQCRAFRLEPVKEEEK